MTEFRAMRRGRQQLTAEQSEDVLRRATSGVLAVLGDGGYPYAVPLSHVWVDGCLYFHSATAGHKVDAIGREPRCSFCVVERDEVRPAEYTTYFCSVVAFGRIAVVTDPGERLRALRLLGRRHNPVDEQGLQREIDRSIDHVLVLKLVVEHLTGKQAIELCQKA